MSRCSKACRCVSWAGWVHRYVRTHGSCMSQCPMQSYTMWQAACPMQSYTLPYVSRRKWLHVSTTKHCQVGPSHIDLFETSDTASMMEQNVALARHQLGHFVAQMRSKPVQENNDGFLGARRGRQCPVQKIEHVLRSVTASLLRLHEHPGRRGHAGQETWLDTRWPSQTYVRMCMRTPNTLPRMGQRT